MKDRPIRHIAGLREIVDRYDGLILDLWGTLHDGATPYSGVVQCLEMLRQSGKRCVLLSNAPRRAAAVIGRVGEIGIARHLYEALVTSGEAGWHALAEIGRPDASDAFMRSLGPRCFYLGPGRDRGMLEGVPVEEVQLLEDCDFILCTGLGRVDETPADYENFLASGVRLQRPLLCVNPDLIIHRVGKLEYCAGALAARYVELGGTVHQFGKPFVSVYKRTLEYFAGLAHSRILAVGDSLRTDIAGANSAGLESLLLTDGIHVEELQMPDGGISAVGLANACRQHAAFPTWVAARFVW